MTAVCPFGTSSASAADSGEGRSCAGSGPAVPGRTRDSRGTAGPERPGAWRLAEPLDRLVELAGDDLGLGRIGLQAARDLVERLDRLGHLLAQPRELADAVHLDSRVYDRRRRRWHGFERGPAAIRIRHPDRAREGSERRAGDNRGADLLDRTPDGRVAVVMPVEGERDRFEVALALDGLDDRAGGGLQYSPVHGHGGDRGQPPRQHRPVVGGHPRPAEASRALGTDADGQVLDDEFLSARHRQVLLFSLDLPCQRWRSSEVRSNAVPRGGTARGLAGGTVPC